MVVVQRWSGREARLLREALRMSVREFANRLGYNDASVSNWERRKDQARLRGQTQRDLDTALRLAGPDAQERFQASLVRKLERESSGASAAAGGIKRPDSPIAGLASLSIETPVPTSVGWPDVEHVRHITRALALSENTYGGGFSGQAAAAQLRYSAQFVEVRTHEDVRRAMYEAVGNLGSVVGFSAFDVADYRSAQRCFGFSLWCAEQARSWPLQANALSDMARLATYRGDIDDALVLVESAQVRSNLLTASARAMLSAMRARLLALQGRHSEALSEVARADEQFGDRNPDDDPPWLSYYDEAEHQGSTGRALVPIAVTIGNPSVALPRLQAAVRLHDSQHPRSRAFSRTRLASLMMKIGDPRQAASVGRVVLAEASTLRSSRLRSEIDHLGSLAAAHEKIPEVADLRHEIMTPRRTAAG